MVIEAIGPIKDLPAKGNYGPSKIYSVKFKENPNWADVFQPADKPAPLPGDNLDGTIEKTQYGYSFRKTRSAFGKGGGLSNRQIALQAASRVGNSIDDTIIAAERFLVWLDKPSEKTTITPDQPPVENYEGLGLN